MSEVNTLSTNMEDFKELQQRLNHDSIKFQFRSKLIGGLNEEDVTEYIEKIEAKLRGLEQKHNQELNEIFSLREILNREIQDKKNLQESLDNALSLKESNISEIAQMQNKIIQMTEEREELEKQLYDSKLKIDHLDGYGAEYEENYNLLKLKTTDLEKENSEIPQLKNEIQQMTDNKENLEKQISESNLKFERVMEYAVKFEEENAIMKTKILNLEQENSEIPQLKMKIKEMTDNQEDLEKQLSDSNIKFEKVMDYAVKFEEENATMKTKILNLEQENSEIDQFKHKILQLTNEQEELVKQLSESKAEIEQINKYDDWLKENNNVLKTKISELEQEISSNKIQNAEINDVYEDLVKQIESEKSTNEALSLESELNKQKIETLEDALAKKMAEIEELQNISKNAEQELNLEKAKLSSYKISGFKDELSSIYKQIETLSEDLEQHVKINNELNEQIQLEQLRANKAENNLDSLNKLVSTLKDELNNEQNLIDAQFKQILEKRNKFQSDIEECLMKFEVGIKF